MASMATTKCINYLLFGICIGIIIIQCMKKYEKSIWYDEREKIHYDGITMSEKGRGITVIDKWLATSLNNSKRAEDELNERLTKYGLETTGNLKEKHCRFKKALGNCENKYKSECSNYGC